ncbi:carboxylic ester hydrolase [Plakobranchus ocellatus]|uniref:Carboxylic ester hydrolase n=1 Tax=Plakobranchus ocellatus TaxID=259542 RepID=A0AAV3ZSE7_9GAST|nr:carboxylic ester hydrolase [Plakobranchus ocellatus]
MEGQTRWEWRTTQFWFLCLLSNYVCAMSQQVPVIADIWWGRIQGLQKRTQSGSMYYSFEGIPYAQPPVGRLRFAKPLPLTRKSPGVYEAHTAKPSCFGVGVIGPASEDCLYLDIYVPAPTSQFSHGRSVMVFLHGGGFVAFSGQLSMEALMSRGVAIVVFVHYRLGPFGFLSTGEKDLPGNFGLWDQNMALRWVRGNIASFGGNPSSVTIFGHSAGGASVAYHVLAPPSKAFVIPSLEFSIAIGNLQAEAQGTGKTYFYYFDYCPKFSPVLCMMHGLDQVYVFPLFRIIDPTDAHISQMFTEILTSFSGTGIPQATGLSQQWTSFSRASNYSVLMLKPSPVMHPGIFLAKQKLWLEEIPALIAQPFTL